MKILLVEDNLPLCENLTAMLEQEGYSVRACHDGIEAEFLILSSSTRSLLPFSIRNSASMPSWQARTE